MRMIPSACEQTAKQFFKLSSAFIFLVAGLWGCTGDDGAIGPVGPKGDTGATGSTGPIGTANVIYSEWKAATNFRDTTFDGSLSKIADVAATSLTTEMLPKSDVHVYMTFGGTGQSFPLPYTSNAGGKANTIQFYPKRAKIIIARFAHDNSNSVALGSGIQYRYIIIPGGVAGRMDTSSLPDFNDYVAVCRFYRIPE